MCEHVITYFTFLPTFQCLIVGTIQFRAVQLVVVAQATMWSSMTNVECRSVLLTQQPTGMCIVCMNWTRLGREFALGPWAIVLCRTGGRVMPFIDAIEVEGHPSTAHVSLWCYLTCSQTSTSLQLTAAQCWNIVLDSSAGECHWGGGRSWAQMCMHPRLSGFCCPLCRKLKHFLFHTTCSSLVGSHSMGHGPKGVILITISIQRIGPPSLGLHTTHPTKCGTLACTMSVGVLR